MLMGTNLTRRWTAAHTKDPRVVAGRRGGAQGAVGHYNFVDIELRRAG